MKRKIAFTPLEAGHRRRIDVPPMAGLLLTGFTLIELILVVTVVATLALIAIPNFSKSKSRAMEKEGIANVKLIAAAERIYNMEQGGYVDCSGATDCNTKLKLMLSGTNWSYVVSGGVSGGNITATATGMSCSYTMGSADFGEPTKSDSCP